VKKTKNKNKKKFKTKMKTSQKYSCAGLFTAVEVKYDYNELLVSELMLC